MKNLHIKDPTKIKLDPREFLAQLRVTYDEFLAYDYLPIEFQHSKSRGWETGRIKDAVESMFTPGPDPLSFRIYLSFSEDLYKNIILPKRIAKLDIFRNYCTRSFVCPHAAKRNLIFQGFNESWRSLPYRAYGGFATWFIVISGELRVHLLKVTEFNLKKYSTCDEFTSAEMDSFKNSPDTKSHTLKKNDCLVIPPGWMILIKARDHSFAFSGEYLDQNNIATQLDLFEYDTVHERIHSHTHDRDIRCLYWLFAAQSRENRQLRELDEDSLNKLRGLLGDWRVRANKDPTNYEDYIPYGILSHALVKSINDFTTRKFREG